MKKRSHLWFRNIVAPGRPCHPLGLLVTGVILATIGSLGTGVLAGVPLPTVLAA